MNTDLLSQVRAALDAATQDGDPLVRPLAQLPTDGPIDEKYLTHIAETPSGKQYGLLTYGAALKWATDHGLKPLTADDDADLSIYKVQVFYSGYDEFTVEAYSDDEAREIAEEEAYERSAEVERDVSVVRKGFVAEAGAA